MRKLLTSFFIFLFISIFFFFTSSTQKAFAFSCDQYTSNLYGGDGNIHTCGSAPDGSQQGKYGICIFGTIGCEASILPGMKNIDSQAGTECGDANNGTGWGTPHCERPINPNGQFCSDPENTNNNQLATFLNGNLDVNHYCKNGQVCYMDSITNPSVPTRNCSGDPRSNKICLNPGNKNSPWNDWVDASGKFGYEGSGYACFDDCNGNYTTDPKQQCQTGPGGSGGTGDNFSGGATPTPFALPCKFGKDASGREIPGPDLRIVTCDTFASAVGNIDTSPTGLVTTIFRVLLGISGGVCVLLIIIAGYQLGVSQGNPEHVKESKEQLTAAIVGLLFIIFSTAILQIIGVNILGIPGFITFK